MTALERIKEIEKRIADTRYWADLEREVFATTAVRHDAEAKINDSEFLLRAFWVVKGMLHEANTASEDVTFYSPDQEFEHRMKEEK